MSVVQWYRWNSHLHFANDLLCPNRWPSPPPPTPCWWVAEVLHPVFDGLSARPNWCFPLRMRPSPMSAAPRLIKESGLYRCRRSRWSQAKGSLAPEEEGLSNRLLFIFPSKKKPFNLCSIQTTKNPFIFILVHVQNLPTSNVSFRKPKIKIKCIIR